MRQYFTSEEWNSLASLGQRKEWSAVLGLTVPLLPSKFFSALVWGCAELNLVHVEVMQWVFISSTHSYPRKWWRHQHLSEILQYECASVSVKSVSTTLDNCMSFFAFLWGEFTFVPHLHLVELFAFVIEMHVNFFVFYSANLKSKPVC